MAGGKWTILDSLDPSQRSGFYINFVSDAVAGIQAGATGVVAIPVTAPWGPEGSIVSVATMKELEATFSAKKEGTAYFQIKEALRSGARMVLAYRMATSAARAQVTLQSDAGLDLATVSARWTGSYGNDISVSVDDSLSAPGKREFRIHQGSTLLERYTFDGTSDHLVTAVGDSSAYVTLTLKASGSVEDYTNTFLTGGDSGLAITASQMTFAFNAFEGRACEWNILAVPTNDMTFAIQNSAVDFVKRLRSEGNFVTLCLGHMTGNDLAGAKSQASGINSEAVVYHNIGAVIEGVSYAPYELVGKIAGMIAGAGPNESVTYAEMQYVDALTNILTHTQVKEALRAGLLVAFNDGTANRIEKGINTLTRYGVGQHEGYSKIKVIAVLDAIGNALTQSAARNYIGKVLNDEAGQQALIGAIKDAFDLFVQGRLIKPGYTVALDPNRPSIGDMVFLTMAITPVDAMEEVYATIRVGR